MPRKKTRTEDADQSVFSRRFCELMDSTSPRLTQQELGDKLGVSKSSIGFYRDGTNMPTYSLLVKIADYFGCTTDYLLGRTDYKGTDWNMRAMCDYIGLSEHSIISLRNIFADSYNKKLLEKRRVTFENFLDCEFKDIIDAVIQVDEQSTTYNNIVESQSCDYSQLSAEEKSEHLNKLNDIRDNIDFILYKESMRWKRFLNLVAGSDDTIEHINDEIRKINKSIMNSIKLNCDNFLRERTEEGALLNGIDTLRND